MAKGLTFENFHHQEGRAAMFLPISLPFLLLLLLLRCLLLLLLQSTAT